MDRPCITPPPVASPHHKAGPVTGPAKKPIPQAREIQASLPTGQTPAFLKPQSQSVTFLTPFSYWPSRSLQTSLLSPSNNNSYRKNLRFLVTSYPLIFLIWSAFSRTPKNHPQIFPKNRGVSSLLRHLVTEYAWGQKGYEWHCAVLQEGTKRVTDGTK